MGLWGLARARAYRWSISGPSLAFFALAKGKMRASVSSERMDPVRRGLESGLDFNRVSIERGVKKIAQVVRSAVPAATHEEQGRHFA